MRWASIETKISSKVKEKEIHQQTRKVCTGEKLANLIKEKTIKVNLMNRHFIHAKSYIT